MLADTPIAFLKTLDAARRRSDGHWRSRTANASDSSRLFCAVADDGRWLGTMGGYHAPAARHPHLVGVYVTPAHRGREHGVTDALLDAVVGWAAERSERLLLLQVHETNESAIRYYRRRAFEFTGGSEPYPLDRSTRELEMARTLTHRPHRAPASVRRPA